MFKTLFPLIKSKINLQTLNFPTVCFLLSFKVIYHVFCYVFLIYIYIFPFQWEHLNLAGINVRDWQKAVQFLNRVRTESLVSVARNINHGVRHRFRQEDCGLERPYSDKINKRQIEKIEDDMASTLILTKVYGSTHCIM